MRNVTRFFVCVCAGDDVALGVSDEEVSQSQSVMILWGLDQMRHSLIDSDWEMRQLFSFCTSISLIQTRIRTCAVFDQRHYHYKDIIYFI